MEGTGTPNGTGTGTVGPAKDRNGEGRNGAGTLGGRFGRGRGGQGRDQRYKEEMFRQREEHWQDMRKTLENFGTQGRTGVDREQADENSGVALGITTLLITS